MMACEIFTVDQYLRGKVDFPISDEALRAIRYDRHVDNSDLRLVNPQTLELCLADVYMWVATTASVTSGAYDSDGGWQHQESNKTMSEGDKKTLRKWAQDIYAKYNDPAAKKVSGMVLRNLY